MPAEVAWHHRSTFSPVVISVLRCSIAGEGRGSHSFADLRQLGERVANVSTLVFAMGLIRGLELRVNSLTQRSQDISDLPWARWRAFHECKAGFSEDIQALGDLRSKLRVVALLVSYVDAVSIRRFWWAMCLSHSGRRWHSRSLHLGAAVFGILWTGEFGGCDLLVAVTKPAATFTLAHPACQCGTRPQFIPGSSFRIRGGGDIHDGSVLLASGDGRWPRRVVQVPWWVSRSLYSKRSMLESALLRSPKDEVSQQSRDYQQRPLGAVRVDIYK
jgi:hypothetical protein